MARANSTTKTIEQAISEKAKTDAGYAIAWALIEVADSQREIARQLNTLGISGANTPMGAIELLASEVRRIADAFEARQ